MSKQDKEVVNTKIKKTEIRKRILRLLKNQREEDRLTKSRIIQKKLFAAPDFQRAQHIMFYASFDGEVETFEMMKQTQEFGKKVVLPRVDEKDRKITPFLVEDLDKDLVSGTYSIKEPNPETCRPLPIEKIGLIIVPALAFDKRNNRLGRGGGFYDRFLAEVPTSIPTVGIVFDFQILENLPHIPGKDFPVSCVITN